MMTTRNVSYIDPSEKTLYPKCNLKKEHQKDSLNMICLTKTCISYGPICGLCKKNHSGHNVVSIKSFITSIQQAQRNMLFNKTKLQQKRDIQETSKKSLFQTLHNSYIQIMSMLKSQVKQLSQQIQKTQSNLIRQFEQVKQTLKDQEIKQQIITDNLIYLKNKRFEDGLEFRKSINVILKLITIDKGCIQIPNRQDEITKNYQKKIQTYKQNLLFTTLQIKQLYASLQDQLMREKVQKVNDIIRPKTAIVGLFKQQAQVFSKIHKNMNIKLDKDAKCATSKDYQGGKVIFLHNLISNKILSTTLKILNDSAPIILGVAHKDGLILKYYKFQKSYNNALYGIMSNGTKINHTQKNQDGNMTGFTFVNGDQITITLKIPQKKLLFSSKDHMKKTELNLKSLPDKQFKDLQFCVVLGAMGDKVQIL